MATTTNYSWSTPDDTALVKDGAAAIRSLGTSIDTTTKALNPSTTLGDIEYRSSSANTNTRLPIGTTGQVLAVVGGVPAWATTADQTPLTTKGDLFTFDTADARLGVGTNGHVLTADSAAATGLKWAAPASGLTIAQIASGSLSTISTQVTGLSAYDSLTIYIEPSFSVYANDLTFGFNNTITNTDYTYNGDAQTGHNTGAWIAMPSIGTPASYAAITITLTNCKAAGFTNFQAVARFTVSGVIKFLTFNGIYKSAAAISSIEMKASSGTMSGSYVVWGG